MLVDGVAVEAKGGYTIKEGSTYVVFLQPARQSTLLNDYQLYAEGIFEIDGSLVVPLFKDAEKVFGGAIDTNVTDFVRRIMAHIERRKSRARNPTATGKTVVLDGGWCGYGVIGSDANGADRSAPLSQNIGRPGQRAMKDQPQSELNALPRHAPLL